MITEVKTNMRRVGNGLPVALVLSLLLAMSGVLALLLQPAQRPPTLVLWSEHVTSSRCDHGGREAHLTCHRTVRRTTPVAGPRAASPRRRAVAALPAGRGPTVVTVRAAAARLTLLDTVTIAATFYDSGSSAGPYAATLQLLARGRGLSATQDGFSLHHSQRLTLYWEWRAGASLPTGVYTVRVLLRAAARPGHVVASGTASTPLTVVTR